MVALFRPAHDLWPGDAAFAGLVRHLRRGCPEFEGWWADHGIGAPVSGSKVLHHPTLGILHLDHATFQANDDPALRLALYTRR